MKFSFEWLKNLVKTQQPPKKLAELLTMYFAETTVSSSKGRVVLDVDLLANRVADASGHLGLAREIAAISGKRFSYPQERVKEGKEKAGKFLKVKIETPFCNSYLVRVVKGIVVKPSPSWLQKRLIDCGLRPINNIVDATNYIMLETGQPLHVFDYDKIDKESPSRKMIIIRQAKKGEKITTLENKNYPLDPSIMVIADSSRPLALAGIKGGEKAGISKKTTNVILESANFQGANIRHTSRKLGLVTDASLRFEHNLMPSLSDYALDRVALLIQQLAGGEILQGKVGRIKKQRKIIIPLRWGDWEKFLGEKISRKIIIAYLSRLGFAVESKKKYLLVSPPPFRNDIHIKEDVMGEVMRLQGVNNIPSQLPIGVLTLPPQNEFWQFRQMLRDWLRGDKLDEVYTYSFLGEKDKEELPSDWQERLVEIANPPSALVKYLRPSLLINLLKAVSANFRFQNEINFFEIGKIYWQEKGKAKEKFVLGGILARKKKFSSPLFYQGKGILEDLFSRWGVDEDNYELKPLAGNEYSTLLSQGTVIEAEHKVVAVVGVPSSGLLKRYGCQGDVVFWEINLSPFLKLVNEEREYQPLPKFPAVIRDISLLLPKSIPIAKVLKTIQSAASSYLEDVDLFDIYEGKNLSANQKSLSFHLIFRASDHTLRKEKVDKEMSKIYQALDKIKAKVR